MNNTLAELRAAAQKRAYSDTLAARWKARRAAGKSRL
jgi:hypothetical protein